MNQDFWKGKKVLLTGHTGFKGGWLSLWLQSMGAIVTGLSLDPRTEPNIYTVAHVAESMDSLRADICSSEKVYSIINVVKPEIVFHFAAQPLVRYSYKKPIETYETNVMGTLHVLEAIRKVGTVRSAIMVTTDKCYKNKEWHWGYREIDPMGGYDPYSSSKGAAELLIDSYRQSFFNDKHCYNHGVALASVRSGNVIGGGDWAADRLIPDIIRAFSQNEMVNIRNPQAIRPWQHVLEPLNGYLLLAEKLYQYGDVYADAWNFGPNDEDAKTVEWIANKMVDLWGGGTSLEVDESDNVHEACYLKLDCSKAKAKLAWFPRWSLDTALEKIIDWQQAYLNRENMKIKTLQQIFEYSNVKVP